MPPIFPGAVAMSPGATPSWCDGWHAPVSRRSHNERASVRSQESSERGWGIEGRGHPPGRQQRDCRGPGQTKVPTWDRAHRRRSGDPRRGSAREGSGYRRGTPRSRRRPRCPTLGRVPPDRSHKPPKDLCRRRSKRNRGSGQASGSSPRSAVAPLECRLRDHQEHDADHDLVPGDHGLTSMLVAALQRVRHRLVCSHFASLVPSALRGFRIQVSA